MRARVAAGFLAGVLVASGIMYLAMRGHRIEPVASRNPEAVAAAGAAPEPVPPVGREPAAKPEPAAAKPARKRISWSQPAHVAESQPAPLAAFPESGSPPESGSAEASPPAQPAPASDPAPAATPVAVAVPTPPPSPEPLRVTLDARTLISVRLEQSLDSNRVRPGDIFAAALDAPVIAGGYVIAERRARAAGRVVQVEQAGRMRGVARIVPELQNFVSPDGQTIPVHTATFEQKGPESKAEDAAKAGIGAVLGAVIGGWRKRRRDWSGGRGRGGRGHSCRYTRETRRAAQRDSHPFPARTARGGHGAALISYAAL